MLKVFLILLITVWVPQLLAVDEFLETEYGERRIKAKDILHEDVQVVLNCRATYLKAKDSATSLQNMYYQGEMFKYSKINNDLYFVSNRFFQNDGLMITELDEILDIHDEKTSYYFVGGYNDTDSTVDLAISFVKQLFEKEISTHKDQFKLVLFNPEKLSDNQLLNHLRKYFLETNVLSFIHSVLPLGGTVSPIKYGIPIRLGYLSFLHDFGNFKDDWKKIRTSAVSLTICVVCLYWFYKLPLHSASHNIFKPHNNSSIVSDAESYSSLEQSQQSEFRELFSQKFNFTNDSRRFSTETADHSSTTNVMNIHYFYENLIKIVPTTIFCISAYIGVKNFIGLHPFPSERSIKLGFQNLISNYKSFRNTLYSGIGKSPLLS